MKHKNMSMKWTVFAKVCSWIFWPIQIQILLVLFHLMYDVPTSWVDLLNCNWGARCRFTLQKNTALPRRDLLPNPVCVYILFLLLVLLHSSLVCEILPVCQYLYISKEVNLLPEIITKVWTTNSIHLKLASDKFKQKLSQKVVLTNQSRMHKWFWYIRNTFFLMLY